MQIKKIAELTDGDHVVLNDVFIYVLPAGGMHHIVYDADTRYILQYACDYVEKYALDITPPDINTTDYVAIDEAYSCLYQGAKPPSHNYLQFVRSYQYLSKNKINTMLVYDVNYPSYNAFNQFAADHLVQLQSIYKCKLGVLYKVKKLTLGISRGVKMQHESFMLFSKKLDEIIPKTENKLKYFNLKLQQNNKQNWTGERSFKNDDYILTTLATHNYLPLDMTSEFSKQTCLRNSSYLIFNFGGNIQINGPCLFNKNKPILVLCHISYKHEYENSTAYKKRVNDITDDNTYKNNIRWVFDLPDDVVDLDKIIESFERDYNQYL